MKIKAVCEQTGLTDRTVRYYIEENLIAPSFTENYLGRKTFDFSEKDIDDLKNIAVLRSFGFSVDEIKTILTDPQKSNAIITQVISRTRESLEENEKILKTLSALNADEAYTVARLASVLSAPNEMSASDEDVTVPFADKLFGILKPMGIFIAVWVPLFISALIFVVRLCTCKHPVLHPLNTVLVVLTFIPTALVLVISRFRISKIRAVKRALLILCMCCIPASGLLSWNAVAECSHSWGDFTVEINATCSEEGKLVRDCLVCRATDTAKVEMLSHTVAVDKEIPPTCTSEGLSEGSHCSVCGSMIREQTVLPVTEHIPDVISAVEATCTVEGLTEGVKCADCGVVLKEQEKIPTVSHVPVIDPAVKPNCQRFGLTEGSHCGVCSQVLDAQQVVPRLEHSYTQNVVAPTCQDEGYTVHTCDCGYSYISNEGCPTFEHVFEPIEDGVGFTCAKCELTVCEYGNVGSDSRVRYYITGTTTEANPKRTLIIFGSGKMPDFAPDVQPPWISRSREITAVILEEGITTVGYCAFYVPEGEYWYSNVRSFVIRHKGLTIRDAISVSGIKCSITYYHH